ncbi:Uncharacterised protein [Segatella copri]|nr:Uncharacterised protein [Segatella copri]
MINCWRAITWPLSTSGCVPSLTKAKLRTISSFACFDSASATAYFSSSLLISLVA